MCPSPRSAGPARANTRVDYRARIDAVLAHIEAHLDDPVTPAALARLAAFSPYHFHRVFRGMTGESVMACTRRLRLERAARRLRRTDARVTDEAFAAGYKSHEAFTRAFAAHFGHAPAVWRTQPSPRMCAAAPTSDSRSPRAAAEIRAPGAFRFAYVRHRGSYDTVPHAWQTFVAEASAAALLGPHTQLVGRYWDDPDITPADRQRYDVGYAVPTGTPAPPGYSIDRLGGGRWAVMVHTGPYTTLSETYIDLVGRWLPQEGLMAADGPCIEVYLNSPEDTPAHALQTEVWAPLARPRAVRG